MYVSGAFFPQIRRETVYHLKYRDGSLRNLTIFADVFSSFLLL